jgi:hypothetical protein
LNKNKKNVDSSGSGETKYKSQISKNKTYTRKKITLKIKIIKKFQIILKIKMKI